jgi:hypothetical protein
MSGEVTVPHDDPLDPQRIISELPDREHAGFLAAYREALDGARDPAGWANLTRTLRAWKAIAAAAARPGFYKAQETALARSGPGMLLEDYLRQRHTP